jgi:hypothetical protein
VLAHNRSLADAAPNADAPLPVVSSRLRAMGILLVAWVKACGDYYAAAALYEQLSALSDAELTRRGLSRATLARDVCAAYDS